MTLYTVIFKWKPAEQEALRRLVASDRDRLLPVFEMLPRKGNHTPAEQVAAATKELETVVTKKGLDQEGIGFGVDARYLLG